MLDRQSPHARLAAATRRRIAALALARTEPYGLRTVTTPGLMVVMTGGLAEVFQELTGGIFRVDHVDPWLTIKGLHHVYKHAHPGI